MPGTPDFDAMYRSNSDPFAVGSSWYEQRKIALVLAALTRPHYRFAWDVAAGTGHLAVRLASRCDAVLATDASAVAVAALAGQGRRSGGAKLPSNVRAATSALPALAERAGTADLVVVSEVLYYLSDQDRAATTTMLARFAAEIVAVNWRHHPDDAFVAGAVAMRDFDAALSTHGFVRAVLLEDVHFAVTVHVPAHARDPAAS